MSGARSRAGSAAGVGRLARRARLPAGAGDRLRSHCRKAGGRTVGDKIAGSTNGEVLGGFRSPRAFPSGAAAPRGRSASRRPPARFPRSPLRPLSPPESPAAAATSFAGEWTGRPEKPRGRHVRHSPGTAPVSAAGDSWSRDVAIFSAGTFRVPQRGGPRPSCRGANQHPDGRFVLAGIPEPLATGPRGCVRMPRLRGAAPGSPSCGRRKLIPGRGGGGPGDRQPLLGGWEAPWRRPRPRFGH